MRYKVSFIKFLVVGISIALFCIQSLGYTKALSGGKFRIIQKASIQSNTNFKKDSVELKSYADPDYGFSSPYTKECIHQYKVNLHAHTTVRGAFEPGRDYAYSPKELLDQAKNYGFDAFAITELPDAGGIVEDPEVNGILYVPGIEYGGTPHLIGVGINSFTNSKDKQKQINHIVDQGGLAYIPHPHFGKYDSELLTQLKNYHGVTVFNSLTWDVALFEGNESEVIPYNEQVVHALLSENRDIAIMVEEDTKYEAPHRYSHQLNTAWMMVCGDKPPEEMEVSDIIQAVKEKRFTNHARPRRNYPEPPAFTDISSNGLTIGVHVDKPSDIEFVIVKGEIKKKVKDVTKASYQASLNDEYIIVRATYSNSDGLKSWAWSNPIYIQEL